MKKPLPPARVFGFIAAEADVCVLLRRGPSKRALMVRWDLATDEFELGQWLFATVNEYGCGLSADGKLFLYDAQRAKASYNAIWRLSAICRPPYFTALALWENNPTRQQIPAWTQDDPPLLVLADVGTVSEKSRSNLPKALWEGRGPDWNESSLPEGVPLDAQWAGIDRRGRILFARQGRIYVRSVNGKRELIDLNPLTFRRVKPPKWATEWPS